MSKVSVDISKNGEVFVPKCGFACLKTFEGQKNFDTDYVDWTIKKVVKVTGKDEKGDTIGVNVDKVIISKRPIRETIMADANNVGIDAYLRPFLLQGDTPKVGIDHKAPVVDYTGMPDDLAGSLDLQARAQLMFRALPSELKGSASTMDEFFKTMTIEKFNSYIEKYSKKEVKKDKLAEEVK